MEAIVNLFKTSWQVMGEDARRKFKRYAVFTLATNAVLVIPLIVLRVMAALDIRLFQLDAIQSFNLLMGLWLGEAIFLIVTFVILSGAYKAIKRDYFARAFPGEFYVEQNHWRKRDAVLLYAGLVGLVGFIPNVTSIVIELTNLPDPDITNIITGVLWIGIAVWAVPRSCERYLSPTKRLSDGTAAAASSEANDANGDKAQ
ncbi:hypothetical protein [Collinsella intestinalis]|uniref:hypothetical protein n=1 Tax=Collinsella intestinalis TaxID=147207 RepID=UPI0025A41E4A|nr:hypothetical protein [Collinsella intestinalis]MDM8163518.1 hypothetical protein [Collinsella intestinalis]